MLEASEEKTVAYYLRDLGHELMSLATAARSSASSGSQFELGRAMAYYEVVTLMQAQANAFGITLDDIGLQEVDPERDLL